MYVLSNMFFNIAALKVTFYSQFERGAFFILNRETPGAFYTFMHIEASRKLTIASYNKIFFEELFIFLN